MIHFVHHLKYVQIKVMSREQPKTFVESIFNQLRSGCKLLKDQARSGRSKTVDSVFLAIEANLVISAWRVSGEINMSHSCGARDIHFLGKRIWSCCHNKKVLQNLFQLTKNTNQEIQTKCNTEISSKRTH